MKYTLITGSSSGIGRSLAYEFAFKGHNLILVARREERLIEIKAYIQATYNVAVEIVTCDLSDLAAVQKLYQTVAAFSIDIWINNAGMGDCSYTWDADIDKLTTMLLVNVNALTLLSSLYAKDHKDQEATLINVSSGGGYFVFSKAVPYSASKIFVSAFSEGLAQNLLKENKKMRVKILCPGGTQTEFVSQSNGGFLGEDIFDLKSFMTPGILAKHAYSLFESDYIIGMVSDDNQFKLRNPIFPYGG